MLMLDYDGTLAPFHDDRLRAFPYPGVDERLRALADLPTTRVVVVSGRSAEELRAMYPLVKRFELWASHGREHITAGGEMHLFPVEEGRLTFLDWFQNKVVRQLGEAAVERKLASVAIHWRGLSTLQQERARDYVVSIYEGYADHRGLELLPFEDGLELRATGRSKADAVVDVIRRHGSKDGPPPIAYLGDDRTDEDAFAALPPEGAGILVRSEPRRTLAAYWLAPPAELLRFLDGWIAASMQREDGASSGAPLPTAASDRA